jgi:diketogulonate reductase-like aldo/keto reductase
MLERLRFSPNVKVQPFVNQVEFHLYMQQEPLRWYLQHRGIILMGYSPLGSADWAKPDEPSLLKDEVLLAVAAETGQQVGAVALKFLQQLHPGVILLVKSVTPARIYSNLHGPDFTLSQDQMERLKAREKVHRYVNPQRQWGWDVLGDGW